MKPRGGFEYCVCVCCMMKCFVEDSLSWFWIGRMFFEATNEPTNWKSGLFHTRQWIFTSTPREQSSFPAPSLVAQTVFLPPVERPRSFLHRPFDCPRSLEWLSRLSRERC